MPFDVGFKTDQGLKRQQNQDSGLALPAEGLFLIADGMGGHRGGEIASSMAVEIIPMVVRNLKGKTPLPKTRQLISEVFQTANSAIFDRSQREAELRGMGTTTTALVFLNDTLTIGHVGDSRCYFLRPQRIWQLTKDHSLVQEKFRAGLITRDQLKTDAMKNIITRSIGYASDVQVETYELIPQVGDVFLLCSDGLSGLVSDQEISEIVDQGVYEQDNIQKAADKLVKQANDHGGDDNITTILIRVRS